MFGYRGKLKGIKNKKIHMYILNCANRSRCFLQNVIIIQTFTCKKVVMYMYMYKYIHVYMHKYNIYLFPDCTYN